MTGKLELDVEVLFSDVSASNATKAVHSAVQMQHGIHDGRLKHSLVYLVYLGYPVGYSTSSYSSSSTSE